MKLIKLEILNLASLDKTDGEAIDFEQGALGQSNIFSIVGPTGSGKSTLLDAICLALYNRAPRYPKKKGDRNQNIEIYGAEQEGEKNRLSPTDARNILTRGKKEGYSKLTFLANNGNVYRAEWHVRIQRIKYADAETLLYKITPKNGGSEEELANWEELPQIIGLDYEQFLRTVLIAQGSFANFLTAKEDERYKLLEKLVGCEDIYQGIANRIKQQKDKATNTYNQMSANQSVYQQDIIPEPELTALKDRINQLEEEAKKVKEDVEKVSNELRWYADEDQLTKNIAAYQQYLADAKQRLANMKQESDRLSLHDSTLEAVNLYKEIKTCEANIAAHKAALNDLEAEAIAKGQEIKKEQNTLDALQKDAESAAAKLENQKPHINRARAIKAQLQEVDKKAKEKDAAKKGADEALAQARQAVKQNKADIDDAKKQLDEATTELDTLTKKIDGESKRLQKKVTEATGIYDAENKKLDGKDPTSLQEAKTAAERKSNDLTNAIRIQDSLRKKMDDRRNAENEQKKLTVRNQEIDQQLGNFNIDALKKELDTIRESYILMTSESWKQHRALLKDGELCPLCGAKEHSFHSVEDVQPVAKGLKTLMDEKQRLLDEKTAKQTKLQQERSENKGALESQKSSLESLKKEIDQLNVEWAKLHQTYPSWPQDADKLRTLQPAIDKEKDDAAKALSDYNTLVATVNTLRTEKETAEGELAKHTKTAAQEKEKAEKKRTDAQIRLATEEAKKATLLQKEQEKSDSQQTASKELEAVKQEKTKKENALKAEVGNLDPDTFERQLTQAKEVADNKVEEKNKDILRMQGDLQGIQGKTDTIRQTKQNEETLKAKKESALSDWLDRYNKDVQHMQPLSIADIGNLYSSTDNWEDIRSRKKACDDAFTSAQTTLQNEEKTHNAHQTKKPQDGEPALKQRKKVLDSYSNKELVEAQVRLEKHKDAEQKMGNLLQQMTAAEKLKTEWEDIVKAIGTDGSQLRKIAQCYTLRFLIEHANDEIRKFNSRYELQQVKNSLGIRVIDHDRADDVRDTTSLSGGETFIVSLGLALGLSSLSSRNISFDNLFIDEGFGTLDPDTLAMVIDSLAMLQSSQGKKVGVISHTDTMSERITTQIRVIKKGNGSSEIKIYPDY